MVKHNNQLPNGHFRKWWERYVKTWFNQPGRRKTRRDARLKKKAAMAPRPVNPLRPLVHPPTHRYNMKLREGKGFTFAELKEAGVCRHKARTIGIAVDHRRRNKSQESLELNTQRLKEYMSKLTVFPKRGRKCKAADKPMTVKK
eukprot:GHVL01034840.1.p1 GENE.GHVL01034840.1~~GHVL01034840.1.p1  ORF type:complete len:144 (+),score=16.94 GHVL01034840.1:58-489(+)